MTRKVVHTGGEDDVFQYTNTGVTTIVAGTLIKMMHTLGVVLADILPSATGSVAVGGIVSGVPKVPGAVFAVGEKLIWDISAATNTGEFDDSAATPATGDVTGAAVAAVAGLDTVTTCTIKLTPGNATIT